MGARSSTLPVCSPDNSRGLCSSQGRTGYHRIECLWRVVNSDGRNEAIAEVAIPEGGTTGKFCLPCTQSLAYMFQISFCGFVSLVWGPKSSVLQSLRKPQPLPIALRYPLLKRARAFANVCAHQGLLHVCLSKFLRIEPGASCAKQAL